MNKRPYQFKKKGNKAQFLFNKLIDEWINAAKRQLDFVSTSDEATSKP